MAIFLALPIVLYGQFQSADRQTRDLVVRAMKDRAWLVSQAMTPVLDAPNELPHKGLNEALAKYADHGTTLRLMLRPAGPGEQKFYYVAAAPPGAPGGHGGELESLARNGVLPRLAESCAWDQPLDIRYRQADGTEEVLTSVIPMQTRWGCWLLISVHNTAEFLSTSIGRPYWTTREIRIAAISYFVFALLAVLAAFGVMRSLRHFRTVTREMREGHVPERSFASRHVAPEFSSVANDFDRLVHDLHRAAQDIRQAAEDNAHSFKAPLGTIMASLEPIKRTVAPDDARGRRAVELIEASLDRLRSLVNSAQRMDQSTADLLDAPRLKIDFTGVVAEVLLRYRHVLGERQIRLARNLDEDVMVRAAKGALDVIAENILDNAIGFSPAGGRIVVSLTTLRDKAVLRVEDEGPGVDAAEVDLIFNRYFSDRPERPGAQVVEAAEPNHAGLGLWIVRRNVEALGGTVAAGNRASGGLAVQVVLPLAE